MVCFFATAIATGCADGGGGDPVPKPVGNDLGNGTPLTAVLGPASWAQPDSVTNPDDVGCNFPADAKISATGLTLSAIDTFDETGSGAIGDFFVQETVDDPPPYSGVTVFGPSFSPPDLRLFNNDVVDFLGSKSEFPGPSTFLFGNCKTLAELDGTLYFRFDGVKPLTPKPIDVMDLFDYGKGRQWVGMLVKVEDVDLLTPNLSSGRYTAQVFVADTSNAPTVGNQLYDMVKDGPDLMPKSPAISTHFKSITGIVTFFQTYQIDPRSPEDFEP